MRRRRAHIVRRDAPTLRDGVASLRKNFAQYHWQRRILPHFDNMRIYQLFIYFRVSSQLRNAVRPRYLAAISRHTSPWPIELALNQGQRRLHTCKMNSPIISSRCDSTSPLSLIDARSIDFSSLHYFTSGIAECADTAAGKQRQSELPVAILI